MPKKTSESRVRAVPAHATPAVPRPSRLRRVPWIALVVTIGVALSSGLAVDPIRDAGSLADVSEATLVRPMSYVVIAPLSNVLDTLTLISLRQHIALVVGLVLLFVAWRVVHHWLAGPDHRPRHRVASLGFAGAIVLLYAASAFLPRPMASLVTDNPSILRVDFHSHTNASHDGHQSVERLRSWHERAGYDVAYVTDHGNVSAAERGVAANPATAANGVMTLQGIEVTWDGEHVTILGAERFYRGLLTENRRDVDVRGLEIASVIATREPVVIWNHPHDLGRLPIASGPGTGGVRAIEVINGAPDDRDASRRNRDAIVALAARSNLALTIGSDNHGYGYATPGWTLMRLFGWRALAGDDLTARIERSIRDGGTASTRVVERRIADPGSELALGATLFTVPARMLTTLSGEERMAWLVWTWLLTAAVWWFRRRRRVAV